MATIALPLGLHEVTYAPREVIVVHLFEYSWFERCHSRDNPCHVNTSYSFLAIHYMILMLYISFLNLQIF